jgi:hypothetical protein
VNEHIDRLIRVEFVSGSQRTFDVEGKVLHLRQVTEPVVIDDRELREVESVSLVRTSLRLPAGFSLVFRVRKLAFLLAFFLL